MSLKLGKKAGRVDDPRTVKFTAIATPQLPPVLDEWRVAQNLHDWPVFANDRIGDCTCAAQGHRVNADEYSAGQRDRIKVTDDDVLKLYSRVTGFDPQRPETDRGAYLIDVLRHLFRFGFGHEADGSAHTIGAYAQVAVKKDVELKQAARMFGGLYLGVGLPSSASDEISEGKAWSKTTDQPYSWGGHAIWMVGYTAKYVTVITWGREQRMTWDFFLKYVDEAWAIISEDFLNRKKETPQGFNLDQLQQILSSIR